MIGGVCLFHLSSRLCGQEGTSVTLGTTGSGVQAACIPQALLALSSWAVVVF